MVSLLLCLSLLLCPARAASPDPAVAAEAQRLIEEIKDEIEEGSWRAADDHHRRLLALPEVELSYADHWRGYLAAQALGDANAQHRRLAAAAALELTDEVLVAQSRLMAWYGQVDLRVKRRLEPRPDLVMLEVPMDPDQRRVFEAAAEQLAATGAYQGLLPLGQYRVGQTSFEIVGEVDPVVVKIKR